MLSWIRKPIIYVFIFTLGGLLGYFLPKYSTPELVSPVAPTPKPLARYTFDALQSYQPVGSLITLDATMSADTEVITYLGHFTTQSKKMSMQILVPEMATPSAGFPVIVLVRGFVDPSIYQTGIGTKNAARYFAARGFVTVSPDFLGFGDSDLPPTDTMAARLEKPAQMLDLLASLKSLSFVNSSRLGLWGHSNGGQIVLSVLEITGKPIPAVLWAPVTKPFPYSLLYYTDEYEDGGKALRKTIADFETDYDVFNFSLDKYLDRLTGPIQLHQGGQDDAVPQIWSDSFVEVVNQNQELIEYFVYESADHNLRPDWDTVVERSYQFFTHSL